MPPYPAGVITQKDIARRLGVSQTLVSRALTGTAGDIGAAAATIRRIRAAAAELHYRPSAAALTLRGRPTRTLGVVIKDFDDPFFGHLIGELQALALCREYVLLLTGAGGKQELTMLLKHRLDGLLIVGSDFAPAGLEAFAHHRVPVVFIGNGTPVPGTCRVAMDEQRGLQNLVQHLKQLGHRAIGVLGNQASPTARRLPLLRSLLENEALPMRASWIVTSALTATEAGYRGMQQLLRLDAPKRPTAVIAMEDVLAQSALRAIFEAGLRAPQDISIAGIDDIPAAAMTIPALTTIRQPTQPLVQSAFELLTRPTGARKASNMVIPPKLIIRESCGRPTSELGNRKATP